MSTPMDEYGIALATGNTDYINWATGNGTPMSRSDSGSTAGAAQASAAGSVWGSKENNTLAQVQALFSSYGLGSLYSKITDFVKAGYTGDTIALLLEQTPEFKQRFPAMDTLRAKGRAISPAAYIAYEQTAAQIEQQYGLPKGMVSQHVTDLLVNDVSASELDARAKLNAAAAIQAPQEVRDAMKQFGYVGSTTNDALTAYYLEPDIALPLLEQQYASAVIGGEAARQGLTIDVHSAENLAALGVTQNQAEQGFGKVAHFAGLESGTGDTVTQQQLVDANLAGNEAAQQAIDRAQAGRVGRFQQGGGFVQDKTGAVGLGSAATR